MAENAQPVFSIEKLYVKDLSLEVPHAPKIFLERENPQVNVQLRTDGKPVDDGIFEVTLTITVSAKLPDERTLFMVEVAQAGRGRASRHFPDSQHSRRRSRTGDDDRLPQHPVPIRA